MAVEQDYFRPLNVPLWQTSHFLHMLMGFHSSLIDIHTKSPFIPDPLQFQMNPFSGAVCVCVCVSDNKDREQSQLVVCVFLKNFAGPLLPTAQLFPLSVRVILSWFPLCPS